MKRFQFKFEWVGPAAANLATPGSGAKPDTRSAAPRSARRERARSRQGWFAGLRADAQRVATRTPIEG
jgi:hypothetical protein